MKLQLVTERILGTLEVLTTPRLDIYLPSHNSSSLMPFVWDQNSKGELNVLNLGYQESWVRQTDSEVFLKTLQTIEKKGSVDPYFDPQYLERQDQNHALNEEAIRNRTQIYTSLLEMSSSNLQELEFLKFSCDPIYTFCVLVGKTQAQDWLCIAPTVAQETKLNQKYANLILSPPSTNLNLSQMNLHLQAQLNQLLAKLEPIKIYGFYGGGYNYSFEHRLVMMGGKSKAEAIENALKQAGMLTVIHLHSPQKHNVYQVFTEMLSDYFPEETSTRESRYELLSRFFQETFSEVKILRCSF